MTRRTRASEKVQKIFFFLKKTMMFFIERDISRNVAKHTQNINCLNSSEKTHMQMSSFEEKKIKSYQKNTILYEEKSP